MAEPDRPTVSLEEGETLELPVKEGHPLFEAQRTIDVQSLDDVRDFEPVREFTERELPSEKRRPAEGAGVLRAFHPSREFFIKAIAILGPVYELKLADFVVPAGSRVVMTSALNRILANDVVIQGTLEVHGELVINCNEIRGS